MSLESDLEPKLAELDRVAKQRYETIMDTRGFVVVPGTTQVDFNEVSKGNVDPIWEVGMVVPQPNEQDLANEQTAYNNFLQQLADLLGKFRSFYALGDPNTFRTMVDRLGANKPTTFPTGGGALSPGGSPPSPGFPSYPPPPGAIPQQPTVLQLLYSAYQDNMQYVDGLITERHWSSPAATTFQSEFLGKFHLAMLWQWGYVRELSIAIEAYRQGITKASEDVKAIADMCIAEMQPFGRDLSGGQIRQLGIISLITSAIALIPPFSLGAGAVSLGTGLVSFLSQAAETEQTSCQVTVTGGPVDIPGVLGSTWDALTTLEGCIFSSDGELATALGRDYASQEAFASPHLTLPRPDLANIADERVPLGVYALVSRPGGSGMVVELRELYRAGYANLPNAASLYGTAATALFECLIPGPLGQFFPRSIPIFNECRDVLAQSFQQVSGSLADAGRALVNTARNYELTDAENSQRLAQFAEVDPWETQPQS